MTMNGEELARYTAVMLQDQTLLDMIDNENYTDSRSTLKLNLALNDALSELSAKYPISVKKKVTVTDGLIPYSELTDEQAFYINRVMWEGRDVPFTVDSFGVHVSGSGTYVVIYTPERFSVGITDDIAFAPEVGFSMVLHLIARNYCLMSGRSEEAVMFDSRYSDYAEMRALKRRAHIPARKFV